MTAKIPVSVVVMTLNEGANLAACLSSLERFREVFVVDSGSADGTVPIARSMGAAVVPFAWDRRYPKKKQWCLDNLPFAGDWVFFVDADEAPEPALVEEIARLLERGPARAGYFVEGRPVFLGRRLRFGWGNLKLALLDRRRARFEPFPDLDLPGMGEVEGHYQPRLDGRAGRLQGAMLHHDRKPLSAWFGRHDRYSDWEAALAAAGRSDAAAASETPVRKLLKRGLSRLPARPLLVFLYGYVARLGFLDGAAGLHWALARAFYRWQVDLKRRELRLAPSPGGPQPASSSTTSFSPPSTLISSNARRRTCASPIR